MKVHYFQRYHGKENVATANTMLLLSRLYHYSSDKFFAFLKSDFFSNSFGESEIAFNLQEKTNDIVLDATITQPSFKIVVETKLSDWFYSEQFERYLNAFGDEKYKVMITLAPELMKEDKKKIFDEKLKSYNYNKGKTSSIIHVNTTFDELTKAIEEVVEDRDYEMRDILDDYRDYCYNDNLIINSDSWKFMRMQLAGTTLDFNKRENVYYDKIERGFRPHDYLGLYKNKSVRAFGKICARILAIKTEKGMQYDKEDGDVTDERKEQICLAIEDGINYGYDLSSIKHRYFFVEKFYETDFKKNTSRAPMGSRIFDLTAILEKEKLPSTQEIAELLKNKTWG